METHWELCLPTHNVFDGKCRVGMKPDKGLDDSVGMTKLQRIVSIEMYKNENGDVVIEVSGKKIVIDSPIHLGDPLLRIKEASGP